MKLIMEAACCCHTGRIRSKNEDNVYFAEKCLELDNQGLRNPAVYEASVGGRFCFAVFDGMGGENFGERAAFAAAQAMQKAERSTADFFVSEKQYLERLCRQLNGAVVTEAKQLGTDRMGTTMAALYFSGKNVYVCNLGDSRAYRLRSGEFLQLSRDHVSQLPRSKGRKAPLSQYLGVDPQEMLIEPYIAKGSIQQGDQYLICSDGLTDMLSNFEIADILIRSETAEDCAQLLIRSALDRGGRDNVTVIVGFIR